MISYIMVSYNTSEFTQSAIESIINRCEDCEIIVVDNNSSDNTVSDLKQKFALSLGKTLRIIACDVNNGFSKANNIGASVATGDFYVFINPDTIALSDIGKEMRELTNTIFANKNVILSPQIINPDMTDQHCNNLFPIINIETVFKRIVRKFGRKSKMYTKADWITGVCFCMKKETYVKLGGWNEKYDLYSEDLDFCYRLNKQLGGESYIMNNYHLIHYGNQSGKKAFDTSYKLFSKKMEALRKFYSIYYSEKKFLKYIKVLKWYNPSEELNEYIKSIK